MIMIFCQNFRASPDPGNRSRIPHPHPHLVGGADELGCVECGAVHSSPLGSPPKRISGSIECDRIASRMSQKFAVLDSAGDDKIDFSTERLFKVFL